MRQNSFYLYYRNGFLAVLCRDSSVVKLYDIRHSMTGTDELEPVIIERNVQRKLSYFMRELLLKWAVTWQIQQNECTPSEDSDQPGLWLDGCPGWSESSLGVHSLCWFCHVAAQLLNHLKHLNKHVSCWQIEPEHDKTNKTTCAQQRLRLALAAAQTNRHLHCPPEEGLDS